ncbi:MAG: DnaJ domain-containing protein [Ramlibacter sp.]
MGTTKARPTLYELLGVAQGASVPEIQAAYRHEMNTLEAQRGTLQPVEFNDRSQLLRVAYSTLSDAVSRTGYDAKLETAARSTPAGAAARALAITPETAAGVASAGVRAEALSMRADALSLRADAMLMRAGVGLPAERHPAMAAAGDVLHGAKRVVRAIGLLFVVGMVAFGIARCASSGSAQKRIDFERKAAEQTALQEYYQTYGVRPANMAELELMQAARQRTANEQRQADQNRRAQDQAERRFEEESHRRGREVSEELRRADEAARLQAQRDRELKFRADQLKLESELARSEADRRRLELQRQQTLEQLKQP